MSKTKNKKERDRKFKETIKQEADPNCKHCNGTGFIKSGWGKGFVCGCVTDFEEE